MSVTALAPAADQAAADKAAAKKRASARAWWLRQVRTWHWISSAVCLVGMLAFAVTGITLNHANAIPAKPVVTARTAELTPALRAELAAGPAEGKAPIPPTVRAFVAERTGARPTAAAAEWTPEEVHLDLPRPGGDGWISVDRASGKVETEKTTRGALSLLNDLHKGRNAGPTWGWFLDVFAGACVLFCLTGLWLLYLHSHARRSTWPLVGAGLVIPVLLVILFIHL